MFYFTKMFKNGIFIGHRRNNPQILVHMTSITTIPTSSRSTHCRFVIFSRNVIFSLFRPLHFVNFCSPKCRKFQFKDLRNANFDGEESPWTTLKGWRHSYFAPVEKSSLRHCLRTWTFPSNHLPGRMSFHWLYCCVIQAVQNIHTWNDFV